MHYTKYGTRVNKSNKNVTSCEANLIKDSKWKSFIRGYSSVFSFNNSGIEWPDASRGFRRDAAALAKDRRRVGQDIRRAINRVTATHG